MAEVVEIANRVREHWLLQGLRVSPVKSEELSELKRLQPEGLPHAYEAFLRIAGLPDDEDREGFRFWLPREVPGSLAFSPNPCVSCVFRWTGTMKI